MLSLQYPRTANVNKIEKKEKMMVGECLLLHVIDLEKYA